MLVEKLDSRLSHELPGMRQAPATAKPSARAACA